MSTRTFLIALCGLFPFSTATADDSVAKPPASGEIVARLSGEAAVDELPQDDGAVFYRSGEYRVTTPLPEGYPAPTPPGVIEVKQYPEVRRATFDGQGSGPDGMRNSRAAFFPLFAHIKTRGIAMTAPVEIEYEGLDADGDQADSYDMSFLYREKSNGRTESYGNITVADAKPVTVVATGIAGDATLEKVREALKVLHQALAESGDWQVAGGVRVLGYNGPDVPQPKRWGEVQLPVEAANTSTKQPK